MYSESCDTSFGEKTFAKFNYSERTVVGASLIFNKFIWALSEKEISLPIARNVTRII